MNRTFALLLTAFVPIAHAASGCEPLPGLITENVRWSDVYTAMTNQSNCTQNCHLGSFPSAGLDLGQAAFSIYFVVNQPSFQLPSVLLADPGNPRDSLFFQKINCDAPDAGGRMPPGGHVPIALQALIYDWIDQGAYGESAEDPIQRDFIFRNRFEALRAY
jgi:hypothetical protein